MKIKNVEVNKFSSLLRKASKLNNEEKEEFWKEQAQKFGQVRTGNKKKEIESCPWIPCGCVVCSGNLGPSIFPTWEQFGEAEVALATGIKNSANVKVELEKAPPPLRRGERIFAVKNISVKWPGHR